MSQSSELGENDLMWTESESQPTKHVLHGRPQTSFACFTAFPPSRQIKSAYTGSEFNRMPRSHVSVARFYDWSDDVDRCVSVSKLYRDMARLPKIVDGNSKSHQFHTTEKRNVNRSRRFIRNDRLLTKGEKDIIEGIYKNRVDSKKEQTCQIKCEICESQLLGDMWAAGRPFQSTDGYPESPTNSVFNIQINTVSPLKQYADISTPDSTSKRRVKSSSISCSQPNRVVSDTSSLDGPICKSCLALDTELSDRKSSSDRLFISNALSDNDNSPGIVAPPSTPDCIKRKIQTAHRYEPSSPRAPAHQTPINRKSIDMIEKKKIVVNVFLPKISADNDDSIGQSPTDVGHMTHLLNGEKRRCVRTSRYSDKYGLRRCPTCKSSSHILDCGFKSKVSAPTTVTFERGITMYRSSTGE